MNTYVALGPRSRVVLPLKAPKDSLGEEQKSRLERGRGGLEEQ